MFPTEAGRRAALHALGRTAAERVVLFALVDDHLHLVLLCTEEEQGRLARAVLLALRTIASAPLNPAHVSAVDGRTHLLSLVRYLLQQPRHHGLAEPLAVTTGSCFPDLVGARQIPGLRLRLATALPRYRLREAYAHVGLPPEPLAPATDLEVRALGAARLASAAAATFGVAPELTANDPISAAARRAVVGIGTSVGFAPRELSDSLRVTPRAIARLADREAPTGVTAVRTWLALEAAATRAAVRRPVVPASDAAVPW